MSGELMLCIKFLLVLFLLWFQGDFNVIVLDWSKGARKLNYYKSVANTRLVGAQVGFLIQALEDNYQISRSSLHIIGLSLGAHVAGYAGQACPGIGRITGISSDHYDDNMINIIA